MKYLLIFLIISTLTGCATKPVVNTPRTFTDGRIGAADEFVVEVRVKSE